MAVKPIKPSEVVAKKQDQLPDGVILAFNELIAEAWDGQGSHIDRKRVLALICSKLEVRQDTVLEKHYLDVEDIYRKAGWVVTYHRPATDENWDSYYSFSKKVIR